MARRIFFSTGEPSGEHLAVLLANAMRKHASDLICEGFGDYRMEGAAFRLWERTKGWARLGPLAAAPHVPRMVWLIHRTVQRLLVDPPQLIVLIDYGAFNLRLARALRARGYVGPILYAFPPSAWRDRCQVAQRVAEVCLPLIPFERQASFYRSLGLAHESLGHPLVSTILARVPRALSPVGGGCVGILPGSRMQELQWNLPPMLAALHLLRKARPAIDARLMVADPRFVPYLQRAVKAYPWVTLVEGAGESLRDVDVALVKSGTAVLEAALLEVPAVAMYRLSPALAWIVRNIFRFRGGFVTLPNLVLNRMVVPELLQEAATPERLAANVEALLEHPATQLRDFAELRAKLGGSDTLERWAQCLLGKLSL